MDFKGESTRQPVWMEESSGDRLRKAGVDIGDAIKTFESAAQEMELAFDATQKEWDPEVDENFELVENAFTKARGIVTKGLENHHKKTKVKLLADVDNLQVWEDESRREIRNLKTAVSELTAKEQLQNQTIAELQRDLIESHRAFAEFRRDTAAQVEALQCAVSVLSQDRK